nr:hypothetical protein [uncultured Niameybacter sp.]
MAQGCIGGATCYEEQSRLDILEDVKGWIKYTQQRNELLEKHKKQLEQVNYWQHITFDFQLTLMSSIQYQRTILYDLGIVAQAIERDTVTDKEITLIRNIGRKAIEYNHEYGQTWHSGERWKEYGDPNFKVVEEMYGKGRDYFVTLQDACNAAHRLEDYISTPVPVVNQVTIGDYATGIQVQQATVGSTQQQTITTEFDYSKLEEVISEIKGYLDDPKFIEAFGENVSKVKDTIECSEYMIKERKDPSIIKKTLTIVKEIAVGVTGSLIASGILGLLVSIGV